MPPLLFAHRSPTYELSPEEYEVERNMYMPLIADLDDILTMTYNPEDDKVLSTVIKSLNRKELKVITLFRYF